ncbi:Zinc finger BED domain-containing protein 1 [Folsomia candida]|uniref:Zinc finger BED domain-containing protein 1 n=1 Tax=Folsomia candida TaxID=158441 RepID=A0A226E9T1_FOLCA|nr:Zinc finger BED domain-containing protein 1 [Folsomia candida]
MSNSSDPGSDDLRIYPVILDGTFFVVKSVDNNGKTVLAKCNLCTVKTVISGSLAATGNFVLHLKRKHEDSIADYENRKKTQQPLIKKKKKELKEQTTNMSTSQSTLISVGFTKEVVKKQTKISNSDQLVLNFIVKGMHPLSTIEQPEFQQLVKGLNPAVNLVSRRKLGRQIADQFNIARSKLITKLQQIKYCCITTDAWTCKGMSRGFLGVTVHWIESDLTRYSGVLACRRFKGTHSYDRIGELLSEILNSYTIQLKQITRAVTDNGSNFVKAFAQYSTIEPEDTDYSAEEDISSEQENYEDLEFEDVGEILDNNEATSS